MSNKIHQIIADIDAVYAKMKQIEKEYRMKDSVSILIAEGMSEDQIKVCMAMSDEYNKTCREYETLLIASWPKIRKALK